MLFAMRFEVGLMIFAMGFEVGFQPPFPVFEGGTRFKAGGGTHEAYERTHDAYESSSAQ
jgi:hypothetical protein